jgi:hypothetical protein
VTAQPHTVQQQLQTVTDTPAMPPWALAALACLPALAALPHLSEKRARQ